MWFPAFPLDNTSLIVCSIGVIAFLIQCFYYLFVFGRIAFKSQKKEIREDSEGISVVIAARNKMETLKKNLPYFLNQHYPAGYEVIVVNDCSIDETETMLSVLSLQYPHLRNTFVQKEERFYTGNKLALTIGLKAARYDRVVFSEPECMPPTKNWLLTVAGSFDPEKSILIGYSSYPLQKTAFNRRLRYETFFEGLHFLGQGLREKPYQATHKNMAFRKSFFFENKGFSFRSNLSFGEDDLFIQDNATARNAGVCIEPGSKMVADIPENKILWRVQRKKQKAARRHYKSGVKIFLLLEPLSRLLLFSSLAGTLITFQGWFIPGSALVLRWFIQALIFSKAAKKLEEPSLVLYGMVYDLWHLPDHLCRSLSNFLPRSR